MKIKNIIAGSLIAVSLFTLTGCDLSDSQTTHIEAPEGSTQKVSYVAEMYDNHGEKWLEVEGTSFDIRPNKVKEYYYDTSGDWTYGWEMSSVMSVSIDGHDLNTCGSTIIFADTSLNKHQIEIPEDATINQGDSADITVPDNLRFEDYWSLNWWWISSNQNNEHIGRKIVIVQSQEGDPIGMYSGQNVSWSVSENLPKTTEIKIDGKMLYIHRANFAIIDSSIFE